MYVGPECGDLRPLSKWPAWSLGFLSWWCALPAEGCCHWGEDVSCSGMIHVKKCSPLQVVGIQAFLLLWSEWGACETWDSVCWVWTILWCCWNILLGPWALFYWTAIHFMWNPGIFIWDRGKTHINPGTKIIAVCRIFIILSLSSIIHICLQHLYDMRLNVPCILVLGCPHTKCQNPTLDLSGMSGSSTCPGAARGGADTISPGQAPSPTLPWKELRTIPLHATFYLSYGNQEVSFSLVVPRWIAVNPFTLIWRQIKQSPLCKV